MSGPAPKPAAERRRRNVPAAGEWKPSPGYGWQHGATPKPPTGLLKASKDAWTVWMGSWFAAFWTPDDLPGLRQVVKLYDQVERSPDLASLHTQLRMMMDTYGVTPKGQQSLRWKRPEVQPGQSAASDRTGTYAHLRAVGD
jgi:hypothetical protein